MHRTKVSVIIRRFLTADTFDFLFEKPKTVSLEKLTKKSRFQIGSNQKACQVIKHNTND